MKKSGEHIRVNFGQSPFIFDIDGMMSASRSSRPNVPGVAEYYADLYTRLQSSLPENFHPRGDLQVDAEVVVPAQRPRANTLGRPARANKDLEYLFSRAVRQGANMSNGCKMRHGAYLKNLGMTFDFWFNC